MINGIDFLKQMYPNRDDKDYQPSGLDLRLGKVYEIEDEMPCGIVDGQKHVPHHIEIEPKKFHKYNCYGWRLELEVPYILEVDSQIKIGNSNAQFYLPRSTLLRCGITLHTALGDLGYNGHLSFLAINHRLEDFYISKGERFAQLIDFDVKGGSESYDGDYQEKEVIAYDRF